MKQSIFWVTRTEKAGYDLALALEAAGFFSIHYPLFSLSPVSATQGLDYTDYGVVVFFSPFAVEASAQAVFSPFAHFFAVGEGTAQALIKQRGCAVQYPSPVSGAEALWSLAFFQERHFLSHRILLVRGEGGRRFFYEALSSFSADVSEWLCYRRIGVQRPPVLLQDRPEAFLVCVISSTEVLMRLHTLFAEYHWLRSFRRVLLCCHPRIVEAAQVFQQQRVYLCDFDPKVILSLADKRPWESGDESLAFT